MLQKLQQLMPYDRFHIKLFLNYPVTKIGSIGLPVNPKN